MMVVVKLLMRLFVHAGDVIKIHAYVRAARETLSSEEQLVLSSPRLPVPHLLVPQAASSRVERQHSV